MDGIPRFTNMEDLKSLEHIHATLSASSSSSSLSPSSLSQQQQHYHPSFVPMQETHSSSRDSSTAMRLHHQDSNNNNNNNYSYNYHRMRTGNVSQDVGGFDIDADADVDGYKHDAERQRRYVETHTSYLNSADMDGSGYMPVADQAQYQEHNQHQYPHGLFSDPHPPAQYQDYLNPASSTSPVGQYEASLNDDEGPLTTPGTPLSFVSLASYGGYESHPSRPSTRPSSRTGQWVDQASSSLNLIMPLSSSAMFAKTHPEESPHLGVTRTTTTTTAAAAARTRTMGMTANKEQGDDRMGFVKMMVVSKSRIWHEALIREMFKWEGIIANDFDDDFLKEPQQQADITSSTTAGTPTTPVDTLVERYASTTILPAWARAGMEEQDMHREIIVKNICIVDTPGYGAFNNTQRAVDVVISYLGCQFQATNEYFSRSAVSNDSLGRFLANNMTGAHSHVDLCLYVIEDTLTEQDIQFMVRLQPFVNIVPVIVFNPEGHVADDGDVDGDEEDDGDGDNGNENVRPFDNGLVEDERTAWSMASGMATAQVQESRPETRQQQQRLKQRQLHLQLQQLRQRQRRQEIIQQLVEHEVHVYGMEEGTRASKGEGAPSMPVSSTLTRGMSLGNDGNDPSSTQVSMAEVDTQPPFVLSFLTPDDTREALEGENDSAVQQLDIQGDSRIVGVGGGRGQGQGELRNGAIHHASSYESTDRKERMRQQLDILRHWIYHENLAALRHYTTLKFLSWRRQLPLMNVALDSSLESGSISQHQHRHHHHNYHSQRQRYLHSPQLVFPHLGERGDVRESESGSGSGHGIEFYAPGSSQAEFSLASSSKDSPPPSISGHPWHPPQPQGQQQEYNGHVVPPSRERMTPLQGLEQLHAQDRQRLAVKVAQMLESYRQVFDRILRERQEAWRIALQGLEREQRIEFLVQEIKRWATRDSQGFSLGSMPQHQHQHQHHQQQSEYQYRQQKQERHRKQQPPREHLSYRDKEDTEYSNPMEYGHPSSVRNSTCRSPSLKDALLDPVDLASSNGVTHVSARPSGRRKSSNHDSKQRGEKTLSGRKVSSDARLVVGKDNADLNEEDGEEDPLGLGQAMGRLLGVVGRGLMQMVVMLSMGTFATVIYTNFLEPRFLSRT
ncbi:hypothetical protein BGZ94_004226 [Podila epigama]|nr:hypothetical protein BGZ94_004226 [Podila epigama]